MRWKNVLSLSVASAGLPRCMNGLHPLLMLFLYYDAMQLYYAVCEWAIVKYTLSIELEINFYSLGDNQCKHMGIKVASSTLEE